MERKIIGEFLRDLKLVKPGGIVRIYAPWGYRVLLESGVIRPHLEALETNIPGSSVRVLTGPELYGDQTKFNNLIQLADKGLVELKFSKNLKVDYEYWLVETSPKTEDLISEFDVAFEQATGSPDRPKVTPLHLVS